MAEAPDETGVSARDALAPFVLALDVGTSSMRAAVYDALAREVAGTRSALARGFDATPDGGAEMDAEEALADAARVLDEAHALAVRSGLVSVASVAVACFWHSLVGLDAAGRALTPVYGWADTRAARHAEGLRAELDERETHARTGCRLHPSYWPARLRRLRSEQPEVFGRAARWLTFGELLSLRFCGEAKASVSMASGTGLLDQHLCEWDAPLLEKLGVGPGRLPPLAADGEALTLDSGHASRWPALRGAAFFPAVGDGATNNVGEGCTSRSRIALMVGTSAAARVLYEGSAPAEAGALWPALWSYRLDRRRVCVGGALSDGGGLFAWMRETLSSGAGAEQLGREVAALGPDAHGLTVLPFWAGERSTGWNGHARGALLGLTTATRPAHVVRAALEAVAYRLAHVVAALGRHAPGAALVASGGALRESAVWPQVICDVLGRPLRLSDVREASSRGAVILALEAAGAIKSLDDIPSPEAERLAPDAARHETYRRGLERQQKLYEMLVGDETVARLLDSA